MVLVFKLTFVPENFFPIGSFRYRRLEAGKSYVNADWPKCFALAQYEDEAHFWLRCLYEKDWAAEKDLLGIYSNF